MKSVVKSVLKSLVKKKIPEETHTPCVRCRRKIVAKDICCILGIDLEVESYVDTQAKAEVICQPCARHLGFKINGNHIEKGEVKIWDRTRNEKPSQVKIIYY